MAIQSLKHLAFKVWTATICSVPISLWLLSVINPGGGVAPPLLVLSISFVLFYMVSGWIAAQLASQMLRSISQEAGVWERNGDTEKAEQAYRKVLALYDSFLTAPAKRRKGLPPLVARMARMYAAQTEKSTASERFMEAYLSTNPNDGEIAESWLLTCEYRGGLNSQQQDIAARIGDAHRDHPVIQMALARLFLLAKRTDYPALQTYRRVLSSAQTQGKSMAIELARMFISEGRSDEWALPIYLQAATGQSPSQELRCGLAACIRWIIPSERNRDLLTHARQILGRIDEEDLIRMSSGFVPPSGSYPLKDTQPLRPTDSDEQWQPNLIRQFSATVSRIHQARKQIQASAVDFMRRSPGFRRAITWSLITGLMVVAATLLVNTVGYLKPTPAPVLQSVNPTPAIPTPPVLPYTLQVAAYLKPEHAERYLKVLEKQTIEAYIIQAHGNQKTWYQVRVGHFPDKATARAYGNQLKTDGIIEDFYVAVDETP